MADSRDEIVFRLRLLPTALKKRVGEISAAAGVNPSTWSNYIADPAVSKNIIPWETASELRVAFRLTLDWIYCGDLLSISDESLRRQIREAERQLKPKKRA